MKVKYEIDLTLVHDRTIGEIESICYMVNGKGGGRNAGIDQSLSIAALFIWRELKPYRFYAKGKELTVREFYALRAGIQREFIHMHRLNYLAFRTLQDVYDWMDDSHLLTYNVKGYWKKIERVYNDYKKMHLAMTDMSTYRLVDEHVCFVANEVLPLVPQLEVSVRDYLIQHRTEMVSQGQKDDITLLTKVQICLMFCAALRNTRRNFFVDIINNHGVDLSADYTYADITSIGRNFVSMAEQLGVKFTTDKDGDYILKGVLVEKSVRVDSAWNRIVKIVTDDELMDEMVLKAINLNPEAKKDYEATLAREEEKMMVEAMGDLGNKYKVGKL
jgi:hypothetical protein